MEFKVGDMVFANINGRCFSGYVTDVQKDDNSTHPIRVLFNRGHIVRFFTRDGRMNVDGDVILHKLSKTLNQYQAEALKTAIFPEEAKVIYPVLGLTGEAGEVAEKLKKIIRDKGGVMTNEDKQALKKELGDVLWYVAVLANSLGFELSEVAELNIQKLRSRQERGKINGNGDDR